jgi:hypothetical protein
VAVLVPCSSFKHNVGAQCGCPRHSTVVSDSRLVKYHPECILAQVDYNKCSKLRHHQDPFSTLSRAPLSQRLPDIPLTTTTSDTASACDFLCHPKRLEGTYIVDVDLLVVPVKQWPAAPNVPPRKGQRGCHQPLCEDKPHDDVVFYLFFQKQK